MTQQLQVRSGDASLAARVDGEAGLPWLLMSNSLAADMSMWDDQIAALSKLHRVIRYDTRGHGRSSAPSGAYSFGMLVADMVAILDALEVSEVDILGLSLGGMTALGITLDHPERVRKLICSNARGVFPPAGIASWDQRAAAVQENGMAAVLDDTLARWFTEATRKERPAVADRARKMIMDTSADGYIACTAALKQLDYLRRLGSLSKPVLYIAGEVDSGAPAEVMREMAAATPGARFEIIAGAAHIANMEKPAEYDRLVLGFLS